MAKIIFTLAFLIFLKIQWPFLNCSSLTYIILSFLLILQNYGIIAFVNLWYIPWSTKKWKNNNKIDN